MTHNIEAANTQNFQWQKPLIIASCIITAISIAILTGFFFGHYIPIDSIHTLLRNIHHIPYATPCIIGGSIDLSAAAIATMIYSISSMKKPFKTFTNPPLDERGTKSILKNTDEEDVNSLHNTSELDNGNRPFRKTILEEMKKAFKTFTNSPLDERGIKNILEDKPSEGQKENDSKENENSALIMKSLIDQNPDKTKTTEKEVNSLHSTFERDNYSGNTPLIKKINGFNTQDLKEIISSISDEKLKKLITLGCTQSIFNYYVTPKINTHLNSLEIFINNEIEEGILSKIDEGTYQISYIMNVGNVIEGGLIIKIDPALRVKFIFNIIKEDQNWTINPPICSIE